MIYCALNCVLYVTVSDSNYVEYRFIISVMSQNRSDQIWRYLHLSDTSGTQLVSSGRATNVQSSSRGSGPSSTVTSPPSATPNPLRRKRARFPIPEPESSSEAEIELFSKRLNSEIKRNVAIIEVMKLKKVKLELEIEKLKAWSQYLLM